MNGFTPTGRGRYVPRPILTPSLFTINEKRKQIENLRRATMYGHPDFDHRTLLRMIASLESEIEGLWNARRQEILHRIGVGSFPRKGKAPAAREQEGLQDAPGKDRHARDVRARRVVEERRPANGRGSVALPSDGWSDHYFGGFAVQATEERQRQEAAVL